MRAELNERSHIIGFGEESKTREGSGGKDIELGSPSVNTRINCFEVKVRQWPTLGENRSKVSNNLALQLSAEKCVLHSTQWRPESLRIGENWLNCWPNWRE